MVFPGVLSGLPGPLLATNPAESTTSKPVVPELCCAHILSPIRRLLGGLFVLDGLAVLGELEARDDDLRSHPAAERVLLHVLTTGTAGVPVAIVAPATAHSAAAVVPPTATAAS